MSQAVFSSINPATTSGNQLATILNDFKNALMSNLKGPTRPAQTTAGGGWIDDSQETPNNYWLYKIYTGATDITVFKVNLATNTVSFTGSDDTFTITRVSADTVGALAKLVKARIANQGQVLSGDTIGEIQFVGHGSDNSSPVVARMKVVATENSTGSANGSYISFEGTKTGEAAAVEFARFLNGNLGIGVTSPVFALHLRSTTGIKNERIEDSPSGVRNIRKKARATGAGQVLLADTIASDEYMSTDVASAEFTGYREDVIAAEAHTAIARGTYKSFSSIKTGEAALTEHMRIGNYVSILTTLGVEGLLLNQQSIATVASVTALNADKAIANFTGATAQALLGINAAHKTKVILLHNGGTAKITLTHEAAGATAANRLKLPKGRNIDLAVDSSVELFYSTAENRWKLKSGSGGGGGEMIAQADQLTIAEAGTIAISTDSRQVINISGNGGVVTAAALPFGNFTGGTLLPDSPMEIVLVGNNEDNAVQIPYGDVDYGVVGNFGDYIDITKNKPGKFLYLPSTKRFYASRGV